MKDQIIKRLHEMRLPAMAAELEFLHEQSDYSELSTDEVLEKIVECEYYSRKNNTVSRYIKQARFSDSNARLECYRATSSVSSSVHPCVFLPITTKT